MPLELTRSSSLVRRLAVLRTRWGQGIASNSMGGFNNALSGYCCYLNTDTVTASHLVIKRSGIPFNGASGPSFATVRGRTLYPPSETQAVTPHGHLSCPPPPCARCACAAPQTFIANTWFVLSLTLSGTSISCSIRAEASGDVLSSIATADGTSTTNGYMERGGLAFMPYDGYSGHVFKR